MRPHRALRLWIGARWDLSSTQKTSGCPLPAYHLPFTKKTPGCPLPAHFVKETIGTLGQCASFTLIDAGSVLLPTIVFFSAHHSPGHSFVFAAHPLTLPSAVWDRRCPAGTEGAARGAARRPEAHREAQGPGSQCGWHGKGPAQVRQDRRWLRCCGQDGNLYIRLIDLRSLV